MTDDIKAKIDQGDIDDVNKHIDEVIEAYIQSLQSWACAEGDSLDKTMRCHAIVEAAALILSTNLAVSDPERYKELYESFIKHNPFGEKN